MGWQRHDLSGVNLLGALTHLATLALQAAGTLFPARGGGGAVGEGVRGGGANHSHQDYLQGIEAAEEVVAKGCGGRFFPLRPP